MKQDEMPLCERMARQIDKAPFLRMDKSWNGDGSPLYQA